MTTASSSAAAVIPSSSAIVEEPSRDELVRIFAKRHPNLSLQEVGELFDDYLALGHLDFRRDELTGEWLVLLSGRNKRQ
jgi:hypothetical protein